MTAIANDLMVDIGLASFIVGASVLFFVAAFSALVVAMVRNPGSMNSLADGELAVRALCCSYFLVAIFAATMVDVLRSGLKAVFVCFAQVCDVYLGVLGGPTLTFALSSSLRLFMHSKGCRLCSCAP